MNNLKQGNEGRKEENKIGMLWGFGCGWAQYYEIIKHDSSISSTNFP